MLQTDQDAAGQGPSGAGPAWLAAIARCASIPAAMRAAAMLVTLIGAQACDRSGVFEVDGVRVAYEELGSRFGETVLLVHGLYRDADRHWHQTGIAELLAETHRVVVFDLRGHGESDWPRDPDDYGAAMSRDATLLLDHLGIDRVHLVGFSVGGRVVLHLLAEQPERAISGVLVGMGWHEPGEAADHELRSSGGTVKNVVVVSLPRLDISEAELAAIEVPLALWVGAKDPVRRDEVSALQRVRPDVPVHVIPGVGHSEILRNGRFQDELAEFLDGGYEELRGGRQP